MGVRREKGVSLSLSGVNTCNGLPDRLPLRVTALLETGLLPIYWLIILDEANLKISLMGDYN